MFLRPTLISVCSYVRSLAIEGGAEYMLDRVCDTLSPARRTERHTATRYKSDSLLYTFTHIPLHSHHSIAAVVQLTTDRPSLPSAS